MYLSKLSDTFQQTEIDAFKKCLIDGEWYKDIPGGFVSNSPNRFVNAYGDGSSINNNGDFSSLGWDETFWTAKINQNNVSLETKTEKLPNPMTHLIPGLRRLLLKYYPNAKITDNTFIIAVCNYYTDFDMNIAAHKDDNIWYPREIDESPVFASITLYPQTKPTCIEEYARFAVRPNGAKWKNIVLYDESVLIMPSDIEHRVMPHTSKKRSKFRPRINITFRSTYPINTNPLMNAMAVANHTRYYRLPNTIHYPDDIDYTTINEIIGYYNNCLMIHNKVPLIKIIIKGGSLKRKLLKRAWVARYTNWLNLNKLPPIKVSNNMVSELFTMIMDWVDN